MNRKKILAIVISIVIIIGMIVVMVFWYNDAIKEKYNIMNKFSEEMNVYIEDKYIEQITKGGLFYINTYSIYKIVVANANSEKLILQTSEEIYVELGMQGYYKIKVYKSQLIECISPLQSWEKMIKVQ